MLIALPHSIADSHEKIPCAFISQAKLSGQTFGRNAALICCTEVNRPKPYGQRKMRMVHHGASRNRSLTAALSALTCVAGFEIVILPASALRTCKPIREALCEHVVAAIFLSRKPCPKLLECDPFCFCHLEAPHSLELLLFYTSTCPKKFPWSHLLRIFCSRLIKADTHILFFFTAMLPAAPAAHR